MKIKITGSSSVFDAPEFRTFSDIRLEAIRRMATVSAVDCKVSFLSSGEVQIWTPEGQCLSFSAAVTQDALAP